MTDTFFVILIAAVRLPILPSPVEPISSIKSLLLKYLEWFLLSQLDSDVPVIITLILHCVEGS